MQRPENFVHSMKRIHLLSIFHASRTRFVIQQLFLGFGSKRTPVVNLQPTFRELRGCTNSLGCCFFAKISNSSSEGIFSAIGNRLLNAAKLERVAQIGTFPSKHSARGNCHAFPCFVHSLWCFWVAEAVPSKRARFLDLRLL